jgi:hypothetical protein
MFADLHPGEIPSTSLKAGSSLRLKNGYGQDDFGSSRRTDID